MLPESPVGAQLRVTGVRLPPADAFRLQEMGVRLGTVARVTQHAAFGGRVIAVAGSRYALDGGTAALIDVEPVGAPLMSSPGPAHEQPGARP